MPITSKKLNYIVWRIENALPVFFSKIPKNNTKYPDTRADCRRRILEDIIKNYDNRYANWLIKLIDNKDEAGVERFIFGIEGIKT